MKKAALIVFMVQILVAVVYADIIILKTGGAIEGEIIGEDAKTINVKVEGGEIGLSKTDIRSIDKSAGSVKDDKTLALEAYDAGEKIYDEVWPQAEQILTQIETEKSRREKNIIPEKRLCGNLKLVWNIWKRASHWIRILQRPPR